MNSQFERALEIAVMAHKGQVDKSGQPYILHPLAVAEQLETLDLKIVALLHDVIEDTDITADYLISQGIPKDLVDVVELLTKPEGEPYEDYIRRVNENPMARQVKLADLAHNTSPNRAKGLNERRRAKYARAKQILGA